jgi:hypothetical protein
MFFRKIATRENQSSPRPLILLFNRLRALAAALSRPASRQAVTLHMRQDRTKRVHFKKSQRV